RLLGASDAAVHGVADGGSEVTWGLHDSVEIEKAGRPAVTVVTEAFEGAAAARAAVLGLPEHPRVIVEHPLASRTPSEVEKVASAAATRIAAGLSRDIAPLPAESARPLTIA